MQHHPEDLNLLVVSDAILIIIAVIVALPRRPARNNMIQW